MSQRQRIVIIGAGFAGLRAARRLARHAVDIILIDRNNYHTFTPLLYQVATCALDPSAVAYPVRSIFRGHPNVRFLLGEVQKIDREQQVVQVCASTGELREEAYDYLLVAAGSQTNYFGKEQIAHHSYGLRDLNDALTLRTHILKLFEEAAWEPDAERRNALMTLIVVGGGPTGLETAGALHELYNHVLDQEYDKDDTLEARVILLEALDKLLLPYPERLQDAAREQLESLGVEVRTGAFVDEVAPDYIQLRGGERIPTYTVVWATGVKGSSLAEMLGVDLERGGRIAVEPTMQVKGLDHIYAAGDIAYLLPPDGETPYPAVIPVAQQQADVVAKNILHRIRGEEQETFSYFDRGSMATIGRRRAVAWVFNRVQLTGFLAWAAWLLLHLMALLGMRNRVQVFLSWVWEYFFYSRSVRLIIEGYEQRTKRNASAEQTPEQAQA